MVDASDSARAYMHTVHLSTETIETVNEEEAYEAIECAYETGYVDGYNDALDDEEYIRLFVPTLGALARLERALEVTLDPGGDYIFTDIGDVEPYDKVIL